VGVTGLGLGLVFAMAPAASAGSNGANDTATASAEAGIATPMRAIMMSGEEGNTSNGLLDAGDSNGANVGGVAATVPVIACGNALNVIGIGARAHCEGVNG
jgi:hypothetical protein